MLTGPGKLSDTPKDTASKKQSWDLNPGLPDPKPIPHPAGSEMAVEGAVAPSCPGLWLRPACVSSALGASPSMTTIPLNQPLLRLLSLRRSPRVEPCEESSVSPVHLVGSASGFLMQVHSCHPHVLHPRCFESWSSSMSF